MTGPEVQVAASTSSLPSAVLLQLLEKEKEMDKEEQPSSLRGGAGENQEVKEGGIQEIQEIKEIKERVSQGDKERGVLDDKKKVLVEAEKKFKHFAIKLRRQLGEDALSYHVSNYPEGLEFSICVAKKSGGEGARLTENKMMKGMLTIRKAKKLAKRKEHFEKKRREKLENSDKDKKGEDIAGVVNSAKDEEDEEKSASTRDSKGEEAAMKLAKRKEYFKKKMREVLEKGDKDVEDEEEKAIPDGESAREE